MNLAFFLTPKSEVVYVTEESTMRQALEKMEHHRYTAIPILDKHGKYVSTMTEGDLLWVLKNNSELNFKNTESIQIKDIPKHTRHRAVSIDSDMKDLIGLIANQNFVPVHDDNGTFIGIIKRGDVINYCYELLINKEHKTERAV